MAKKKTDEVVEEVQPTESKNENKIETPKEEGGDMKVKLPKIPKQFVNKDDNEPAKVDLRKKPEAVEEEVTKVNLDEPKDEVEEKPVEEVKEEVQEETPVLEEVIEEEPKAKTEEEIHFLRVMMSNYEAINAIEEYFLEKKHLIARMNNLDSKNDIEDAPVGGYNFRSLKDSKWYAEYYKDYGWNEFIW